MKRIHTMVSQAHTTLVKNIFHAQSAPVGEGFYSLLRHSFEARRMQEGVPTADAALVRFLRTRAAGPVRPAAVKKLLNGIAAAR